MQRKCGIWFVAVVTVLAMGTSLASQQCDLPIFHGDRSAKAIALTFDDGPSPKSTMTILRILDKENLRATFFVVGRPATTNTELLREIAKRGHEIGNHSTNHVCCPHYGMARVEQEIASCSHIIKQATGCVPTLFRPPYGSFNGVTLSAARKCRLVVINWDIDPSDWSPHSPVSQIISRVLKARNGSIVVMHDRAKTAQALPAIISGLKKRGYALVTVSELIGQKTNMASM